MDKITIETYNQIAKEYDVKISDFWKRFSNEPLDQFAHLVKGKVLDLGSGPGRDALFFKENNLDVICLDASLEMIRICKEKGLEAVVGDFMKIDFADNHFDGVWAYTSLPHIPKKDLPQALREIIRVLKRGGLLGVGFIEGEGEKYVARSHSTMTRWYSFYTKEEIESYLKQYNFQIVYFEKFYDDYGNYLNFIAKKY